mmetsp:Transcript_21773/g.38475  ORF Transcript_21773/g.38475 Transcript_21773/m.38475 type:complete len:214 (-) Transcript_21773:338-979(-)
MLVTFSIGRASPVRAASPVAKFATLNRRRSAGIFSPRSMEITSPITTSSEGTSFNTPSRTTLALAESIALRASADFSADPSWRIPIQVFKTTTPMMRTTSIHEVMASSPSEVAPLIAEMIATMIKMKTRTLLIWSQMRSQMVRLTFSVSALGPSRSRRIAASDWVSPLSTSVFRYPATFSTGRTWYGTSTELVFGPSSTSTWGVATGSAFTLS